MKSRTRLEGGFTLVEVTISMLLFAIVSIGVLNLFTSLVHSTVVAKQIAVASTLATDQMEYLRSLPYDNLAVSGGSIYSTNPLPASVTKTVNGSVYVVKTSISYIDDAYDGCGSYPNLTLKQTYCRNYPPPSGAPSLDSNPADYKDASVRVYGRTNNLLASEDTNFSARVAETASSTGALFINVVDDSGNPVEGATVKVVDSTVSPAVNLSDNTDQDGNAIFYGLPPDTNNYDYQITASESGYSTLATIAPAGTLQPTYSNQKIFTQQSSVLAMTIKLQGVNSLLMQTTDLNGNAIAGAKIYVKGGYKKYTSTSDTSYYYDNPNITTDSSGYATLSNLVPGTYYFCGDNGATGCSVGGTTYYLVAALPYGGSNSLNPINVPIYNPSSPPATTYSYNGTNYLQQVRLMLTSISNYPRVISLDPSDLSLSTGSPSSFGFVIKGANLPCSSTPASCATSVSFTQASQTFNASCTGDSSGVQLTCTVNLSSAVAGSLQVIIKANSYTLTLSTTPQGGLNVTQ